MLLVVRSDFRLAAFDFIHPSFVETKILCFFFSISKLSFYIYIYIYLSKNAYVNRIIHLILL